MLRAITSITSYQAHKTNDIPPFQSLFVMCNSPNSPLYRFQPCLFWVFIHLLEFDLANQTSDPVEDARNKPYRPVPSGRSSLEAARTFRWSLFVFNTLWSAYCSKEVLITSLYCSFVTYVYNDLGCLGDGQWTHRNITLAFVYLSAELGVCLAKGWSMIHLSGIEERPIIDYSWIGDNKILTPDALLSIACSFCTFLTTSHAQDFKDVTGDILVGKHTFPIEYPTASRIAMFTTVFWSVFLTIVWKPILLVAVILNLLGLVIPLRLLWSRDTKADQRSYYMYCVRRLHLSLLSTFTENLIG